MVSTDALMGTWLKELVHAIAVHMLIFHSMPICIHDDTWVAFIVIMNDTPLSNVL